MPTTWRLPIYEKDIRRVLKPNYNALVGAVTTECEMDNFPRAVINVCGGIIVKMIHLLDNPNCSLPDMQGWAVEDLLEWLNEPSPLHIITWEV